MICVSVQEKTVTDLQAAIEPFDFVEVRLDGMDLSSDEIERLLDAKKEIIVTMRSLGNDDELRERVLTTAIDFGAHYVDLELESDLALHERICKAASLNKTKIIISHHDYDKIPDSAALKSLVDSCFIAGADIAKIACRVNTPRDAARLLGLLDATRPIIPIGMGHAGRITRVAALSLGAPFSYACSEAGEKTAPGQIEFSAMKKLIEDIGQGAL